MKDTQIDYDPIRINNWWTGYVYIIKCHNLYKIGYSKRDAKYRLYCLQTGNPYPITLVTQFFCYNACKTEKEIQSIYSHKKYRGEWYKLDEFDLADITNLVKSV